MKNTASENLSVSVYNLEGKSTRQLDLPKELFSVEGNPRLLAQYMRVYLANQRQGNASTKTRGEVTGSTRKIYKQKGTGRARHGSNKAPIFVGGGVVGGPRPKNFNLKINKKQRTKALLYSLFLKQKSGDVVILENDFLTIKPKTKLFHQFLKTAGFDTTTSYIVFSPQEGRTLSQAVRNIPNMSVINPASLNAYEVMNNKKLMFVEKSLAVLKETFTQ